MQPAVQPAVFVFIVGVLQPAVQPPLQPLVKRFDTEFNPEFSAKSPNFRGLVLCCIEADFCVQIRTYVRILQHFSRTTRFAILCIAPISKFEQNFVKLFRIFAKNFAKKRYFSTLFMEFCTCFNQNFTEFRRVFERMMRNPKIAEFLMDSSKFSQILA